MLSSLAVLGLLVVVVVVVVYSMGASARSRRLEHVTRRPLREAGGRFVVDGEPMTAMDGREAELRWEERLSSSGEDRISRITLAVTVPELGALQIQPEWPRQPSEHLHDWDGPLSDHRVVGAHTFEALVWFPPGFGEALLGALDGPECWGSITLEDGVFSFSRAFPNLLHPDAAAALAEPLLARARALLAALPVDPDPAELLSRRLRASREHHDVHWRATRWLFERFADAPEASAVREHVSSLPHYTRLAAAIWGGPDPFQAETRYRLLAAALEDVDYPDLRVGARARLHESFAWRGLHDPRMSADDRLEFAGLALESVDAPDDPEVREGALLDLFDDDQFPDQVRLYGILEGAGWAPSVEGRVGLVERSYAGLRRAMIEQMASRPLTAADAPVIAALVQSGEDVEALVDALGDAGVHAGGQLSLAADDTARGGLTSTADAGAISQTAGDDDV